MFNPAQIIYNEVNEYIKKNNKPVEKTPDTSKGSLMRRTSAMQDATTKSKQPIEDVIDIVLKIRENNPKYKKEDDG
tara:strand:- start:3213 stop:3440 length:228 start_codon:yes stop_codon:yes gene_type:complete